MTKDILNDNFFAFDSEEFGSVESRMYGYAMSGSGGRVYVVDCKMGDIIGGCYINITRKGDTVTVEQDGMSSLYVYYYTDGAYWAVANTFYGICRLLKERGKRFTVNDLYIDQYIHHSLHVYAVGKTMTDEVRVMPFGSVMTLTRDSLRIDTPARAFDSVDLFSPEGIRLVDGWIGKWSSVIRGLYNSGVDMRIDLSGGFDSRVVFALAKHAGVDFMSDTVDVYSKHGGGAGMAGHLADDYEVATRIADRLSFGLNRHNEFFGARLMKNDAETQYGILRNLFMYTHKEGYLCTGVRKTPVVHLGGINGELARRKLANFTKPSSKCYSDPFRNSKEVVDAFESDIESLGRISGSAGERDVRFYLETQNKSHYGAVIYNDLMSNIFLVSPFNDPCLLDLKSERDTNALFALVIRRTAPEIMDIGFSNGGSFADDVLERVGKACAEFPDEPSRADVKCDFDFPLNLPCNKGEDTRNGDAYMFDIFLENRRLLVDYIGGLWGSDYANRIYDYAKGFYLDKDNFYPDKWVVTLTSVIELLRLING